MFNQETSITENDKNRSELGMIGAVRNLSFHCEINRLTHCGLKSDACSQPWPNCGIRAVFSRDTLSTDKLKSHGRNKRKNDTIRSVGLAQRRRRFAKVHKTIQGKEIVNTVKRRTKGSINPRLPVKSHFAPPIAYPYFTWRFWTTAARLLFADTYRTMLLKNIKLKHSSVLHRANEAVGGRKYPISGLGTTQWDFLIQFHFVFWFA